MITIREHGSLLTARDQIFDALRAEAQFRSVHSDWEEREREAVVTAANRYAQNHGLRLVTVDDVEAIEGLAVGHIDYASKLALYVAEMIHGLTP